MADSKNKNRNTVQWKSEFIRVSETQLQMSLTGTFYPYDFRKQNLNIISRPIGEAATNEAMHNFLDNQHGNFVFCTLYNYAPFVFLKSDEQGHFPNVKEYAFSELLPDEIKISPTWLVDGVDINDSRELFLYNNLIGAAEKFVTANEAWYNTYMGEGLKFHYAIDTCLFFNAKVMSNAVGGDGSVVDNFNEILLDIKAGGESYDRYLLYPQTEKPYTVRITKTVELPDEDRTYAMCYVNPFAEYPIKDIYYVDKKHTPTHHKYYIIDNNSLNYTSGYANFIIEDSVSPAKMTVTTKNKKYKRKKAAIAFKVKRIIE